MDYEAIVIGGGHAGIEASLALARLGKKTLLLTQNPDSIGRLSCNPSVGGLGKGNLVREIDALGGQMALLTDHSMIQYRVLNRSRGPAVQAPRAQVDKAVYPALARKVVEGQKNLFIFMDTVVDLIISGDGKKFEGVITERGHRISARAVVLCAGTFMRGTLFIGGYSREGGRMGEPSALGLGENLAARGFAVGRLKTGTPARIKKQSVDFSKTTIQQGEEPQGFSFVTKKVDRPSIPCWITYTTEKTHEIIKNNLHMSPMFSGKISGRGPRYCPSIEDKVVRFAERNRHQIFIEPEGEFTDELYLNGLSSSLPESVQLEFIQSIPGLEAAEIIRPAYAVEYDYLDPIDLSPNLHSRRLQGFFLAGQTNGTSGYEEAAGQGILAGINAARYIDGEDLLILSRATSYIGVMVDDLTSMGVKEPYRMFTSRAERRLTLRCDTADQRLTALAHELGLVDNERWEIFNKKMQALDEIKELLKERKVTQGDTTTYTNLKPHIGRSLSIALSDPQVHVTPDEENIANKSNSEDDEDMASEVHNTISNFLFTLLPSAREKYSATELETVYLDIRYAGYQEREERLARRFDRTENLRIPEGFDYDAIASLSSEGREKLKKQRPITLGQAARIPGVRRSDSAMLMVHLLRK